MNQLFIFQLVTSFLVGGLFIGFLSLLSERLPQKWAGIILMLPSTVVIAFLFMGWTLSVEQILIAIPSTIMTFCAFLPSSFVYYICSKQSIENRIVSILFSVSVATIFWMICAVFIRKIAIHGLLLPLIFYVVVTLLCHIIFHKYIPETKPVLVKYTVMHNAYRAIFAGLFIASIILCAKQLGEVWGGIAAAYPAATFSAFLILHKQHGGLFLGHPLKSMPLGTVTITVYLTSLYFACQLTNIVYASIVSYILCIPCVLILKQLKK